MKRLILALLCFIAVGAAVVRVDESQATPSGPGLLISEFLANPTGNDLAQEYVELVATRAIDFSVTPYSVVWTNNGTATASGWINGSSITYGFNITTGTVAPGDVVYVGGTSMAPTGTKLRVINVTTTAGDGFGNLQATAGVLGNGGANGDAIGVFAVAVTSITSTTVPIDAIFFGTGTGTAVVSAGAAGYELPVNDRYSGGKLQTASFLAPDPASAQVAIATGTFDTTDDSWTVARTWANTATPTDGATALTLVLGDGAPTVASVSPADTTTGVSVSSDVVITFSENVALDAGAIGLDCAGAVTGVTSGGPLAFTFNPAADLPASTLCTVTVTNTAVHDADATDPPDTMAANFVSTFTTGGVADIAPEITDEPDSVAIVSGTSTTLAVVATGTAPLSYQWYQGPASGTTTPVGADSPSFTTPNLVATTDYWVRVSNGVGSDDSLTATVTVTAAPVCTAPLTTIGAIQTAGAATGMAGATVSVRGVVTGDYEGSTPGFQGFFLQNVPADADGDPATSDGIFVFNGSTNSTTAGRLVQVTGTVAEFNGLTELTSPVVEDCGTTGSVTTADLAMPMTDAAFEAYESMLVRFPEALVISEYFNYERFGELVLAKPLAGESRPFTPTAIDEPGAPAIARAAANAERNITLDDGSNSQNPSVLRHPDGTTFTLTHAFRGGDTVAGVTGVLDYRFDLFRIQPSTGATYAQVNVRPTTVPAVGGSLRVVGMNALNYFLTADFPTGNVNDNKCGPANNMECRGWDSDQANELTRQRDKLLAAIIAINPDVAGLMEIENSTGVEPLADIVAGLNAALGAGTYAYINTGTIGGDAIKVGIIYKPAVVSPEGAYQVLDHSDDPRFIDVRNRPTLAQTFRQIATNEKFTIAVNHLKSKGSACTSVDGGTGEFADPDLGDGQGNCNLTRKQAAEALVDWLASDPTASGDPDFLILGDLNAYAKEDPIDSILLGPNGAVGGGDDYTNLIAQFGGAYAYSYVFDGQAGYLDHALSSSTLTAQVTGAIEWHINADEPDVFDYDTSFKPAAQDALYEPLAYRTSDHDPIVVGLSLTSPAVLTFEKSASPTLVTQGDTITYTLAWTTDVATTLTLRDTLPAATQFISASVGPTSIVNNIVTWNLGPVAPGNGSITLTIKTFNAGTIENLAVLSDANGQVSDSVPVDVARRSADYVTLAATANECNEGAAGAGDCTTGAESRGGRGTVSILGILADGTPVLLNSLDTGHATAEILKFTSDSRKLIVTDAVAKSIYTIDVSDPWAPFVVGNAPTPNGGEPTSLAIHPDGKRVFVTVTDPVDHLNNGKVFVYRLSTNSFLPGSSTVGPHPDSISISHDGRRALVANEADDDGAAGGPAGSVSVLNIPDEGLITVTTVPVGSFAGHGFADLTRVEPEFTAITDDGRFGIFTIQNPAGDTALATIDLQTRKITDIKRFTILANGGSTAQAEPDGVASWTTYTGFTAKRWAATVNEEDQSISIWEISSSGKLTLVSTTRVEEYLPVPLDTDPGNSGQPNGLGNTTGTPVNDPAFPFNDGEPDPEGIAVTVINGRVIAIIALEDSGAALVLDITNSNAIISKGLVRNLSADPLETGGGSDRAALGGRPEGIAIGELCTRGSDADDDERRPGPAVPCRIAGNGGNTGGGGRRDA